jgi:ethanolamine permease
MSMLSLFILRKKQPDMTRPFVSPFYPFFPALALVLTVICMGAIVYYNLTLSAYFYGSLAVVAAVYILMGKHKEPIPDDLLTETLA